MIARGGGAVETSSFSDELCARSPTPALYHRVRHRTRGRLSWRPRRDYRASTLTTRRAVSSWTVPANATVSPAVSRMRGALAGRLMAEMIHRRRSSDVAAGSPGPGAIVDGHRVSRSAQTALRTAVERRLASERQSLTRARHADCPVPAGDADRVTRRQRTLSGQLITSSAQVKKGDHRRHPRVPGRMVAQVVVPLPPLCQPES